MRLVPAQSRSGPTQNLPAFVTQPAACLLFGPWRQILYHAVTPRHPFCPSSGSRHPGGTLSTTSFEHMEAHEPAPALGTSPQPAGYMNLLSSHYKIDPEARTRRAVGPVDNRPDKNHCLSSASLDKLFPRLPYAAHIAKGQTRSSDEQPKSSETLAITVTEASNSSLASCSICLGGFEPEDEIRILRPCNHIFHASPDCIDAWILKSHVTGILSEGFEVDERDEITCREDAEDTGIELLCGSCPECRREIVQDGNWIQLPGDLPNRYALITYLSKIGWDVNPNMFDLANAGTRTVARGSNDAWSFNLAPGFDPVIASGISAAEQAKAEEEEAKKWYNKNPVTRGIKKMLDPQREWVDDRGLRWHRGYKGVGISSFLVRDKN